MGSLAAIVNPRQYSRKCLCDNALWYQHHECGMPLPFSTMFSPMRARGLAWSHVRPLP